MTSKVLPKVGALMSDVGGGTCFNKMINTLSEVGKVYGLGWIEWSCMRMTEEMEEPN